MKTAIIIQARMTSTRLPDKVLKEVLGRPLLQYEIERLRRIKNQEEIVVATTVNETDQPIVDFCENNSIACFRGSENDVLGRYYGAARICKAEIIVRVTADCPLIDPSVVDRVIECFQKNQSSYDYVSNTLQRTYPRGLDAEVFSFKAMEEAFYEAQLPGEREHVTPFIYNHPQRYRLGNVTYHTDESRHRLTVDTPEDFTLIKNIIEELYPVKPDFNLEDILQVMERHPDWVEINSMIEQKKM